MNIVNERDRESEGESERGGERERRGDEISSGKISLREEREITTMKLVVAKSMFNSGRRERW